MSEAEYLEAPPPATDGRQPETGPEARDAAADASQGADDAAGAEAEKAGQAEQRKPSVRERYRALYYAYKADGRLFKIGIALVTAVIAACVIVIAGVVSERRLSVVFLRAVVGFFVSGAAMGAALYWLDRFGIPLFIAKHGDQIQMEWLSEAEEPEEELFAAEVLGGVPNEGTPAEDGARDEKTPPETAVPPEAAAASGTEAGEASDAPAEETREELDNTVLDDAFSSPQQEEPAFAPMSADTLEHYNAPKE